MVEEDPMVPTGQLEEVGQAAELLRGELRWTLALGLGTGPPASRQQRWV